MLRQQESSPAAVPSCRPRSVYYDPGSHSNSQLLLSTTLLAPATTRSHSHQNLALSPAVPPTSTAPPHCSIGLTTAAASDNLYTPAKISSSSSSYSYTGMSHPTLVTQLSIASPCAADSPSPVERDGAGRTLLVDGAHSNSNGSCFLPTKSSGCDNEFTTNRLTTLPTKRTTETDATFQSTAGGNHYNSVFACTSGSASMKDIPPAVYVDSRKPHLRCQPPPYLPVTTSGSSLSVSRQYQQQSKLHFRLMGSISNPEFSILPEVMVNSAEKRTQSSSNLYDRVVKSCSVAPIEAQDVSPSREKLNTLSHHVYSSFDESIANQPAASMGYLTLYSGPKMSSDSGSTTSHPMFNIVQKILFEMAEKLNLTSPHIQSVINSVYSNNVSRMSPSPERKSRDRSTSSSYSLIDMPTGSSMEPSAENVLKELDVDIEDKPFDIKFGVPVQGYMTLQYRASQLKSGSAHSGLKQARDCHVLKVNRECIVLVVRHHGCFYAS